ncbi:TVP38/TMEM64 family protein [Kaarinaea lacus]
MKPNSPLNNSSKRARLWQPLLLLALVVSGAMLHFTGVFDWQKVLHWAQGYAHVWWVPVVLICLQAALFTFALPGSTMVWLVAALYEPISAALVLTTGSTLGAFSAYWFARYETLRWANHVQRSHLYQVLEQRGDFLSLCAIRLIPGFPHSVINYGSGMLRLPIVRFLTSSLIGLAVKSFLYSNAIHGAITATNLSELVRLETLGPLVILAILTAFAAVLRNRWLRKQN